MRRLAILLAVVALGASAAPASADGLGRVCKMSDDADVYLELTASQHASCAMARATMRAGVRSGWARTLRVKSPTTGRWYTMRQAYRRGGPDRMLFQISYRGPGFEVGLYAEEK